MTISALKMQFRNLAPKMLSYKDYKTFSKHKDFVNSFRSNTTEEKISERRFLIIL